MSLDATGAWDATARALGVTVFTAGFREEDVMLMPQGCTGEDLAPALGLEPIFSKYAAISGTEGRDKERPLPRYVRSSTSPAPRPLMTCSSCSSCCRQEHCVKHSKAVSNRKPQLPVVQAADRPCGKEDVFCNEDMYSLQRGCQCILVRLRQRVCKPVWAQHPSILENNAVGHPQCH